MSTIPTNPRVRRLGEPCRINIENSEVMMSAGPIGFAALIGRKIMEAGYSKEAAAAIGATALREKFGFTKVREAGIYKVMTEHDARSERLIIYIWPKPEQINQVSPIGRE